MRENLASLLFGGSCFLCRGAAKDLLCPECDADLPRLDMPLCPRCALPSPDGASCGRCLTEKPAYDATRAALAYDFPADALVHALKFRGELALAPLLGSLLKGVLGEDRADCIVPVPLSPSRLRERGYNQAVEIARQLGRPGLDVSLCERTRESRPQMELPYDERQRNVRDAFRCTRSLVGARIAVVDDVMTSGATLNELARTLKAAGALHVSNWVVTRAL